MAHITLLEISYCGSYVLSRYKEMPNISNSSADPEGGGGTGGSDPPGKSQVIWVSIGNKQLDPPWKKLNPPPPWKMLDPLWNLEK